MVAPTLTLSRQREEVAPRPIVKKRQAVAGSIWEAAAVVGRLGGGGAVVGVLQVQFIDKVVIVLLQLKFQQAWVCTGSSSTECWTFQLCSERGTHSANCAEGCSCVDVPVISSDKFPQSRGSNPLAPDSVHPLSGEHSCCATHFVEFHRCSSWTRWRSARCCDDRCSSWCSGKLLTCPYMYNDRCRVHGRNSFFPREKWTPILRASSHLKI